ncbi:MAG: InlB B-repeat-containing protein [Paludibacteraceae bacterium]|nr:InlB B-repeat-containing protein [Paludibacteraceae bacterium]
MRKLKLLSLFAAMLFATSMWADDPIGSIDGLTGKNGSFRIWGWALDPDAEDSYAVTIHVYVFDNATETDLGKAKKGINAGSASISRPDLASIGHGTMHGFDVNLSITDLNPGTYYVRAYALDKQGVNNPMLGYSAGGDVQAATIGSPYTISYNANGGSGAPASQKKAQDVTLTLQGKGSLARTGYSTDGWATSATGNKAYDFGGTYTANAGATLYAHWNVVNYSIGYTLNGGSVSTNPTSYTIATNTITLNNPTKDGYTFKGWTGSNGNTPQTTVQITKGSTGNKTYTANWEKLTYTITYDYAGGSGFNVESYDIETATFTLNNPTRDGYIFKGWTGSNGNTPQMTVQIAKGSTGSKNYTAHWAIDPNTQVMYLDSLGMPAAQEIVAFNRPEAPEVAGFTFVRWDVLEGPLSEGIKLQAIYAENEPSGAPKKQVGKFTLTRKGDKNEYILQTAK